MFNYYTFGKEFWEKVMKESNEKKMLALEAVSLHQLEILESDPEKRKALLDKAHSIWNLYEALSGKSRIDGAIDAFHELKKTEIFKMLTTNREMVH